MFRAARHAAELVGSAATKRALGNVRISALPEELRAVSRDMRLSALPRPTEERGV